ncbi:MAG: hypothetical protein DDT35_00125 [Firmicutes bacterium]|nr:hypothetical protein [Bacillota bacterium]
MSKIIEIIKDAKLTYHQKVVALARAAENSLDVLRQPRPTRYSGRSPAA